MADYGVRITLSASSPVPTYNVAPFVNGVAKLSAGAPVSGWTSGQLIEVSPVGERVDIAQGGNYAEVSSFDCTVSATWWIAFQAAGASLSGALVEVGSFSGSTFTPRWSGVVSDNSWQGAELRISAESLITQRHRSIPTRIVTGQEFPGIPAESEGAVVPIVYGAVEGMTPPTILSNKDYLPAQYTRFGGVNVARASTFVPVYSGVPAITLFTAVFCIGVTEAGGSVPAGVATAIYNAQDAGQSVFLEVVDGTGSGQSRLLVGEAASSGDVEPGNGFRSGWVSFLIASPWDTLPDQTSVLRIYADEVAASLAVGDEATISSVVAYANDNEYPIGHSVETVDGIVFVDVSAEFRNGEDYAALEYRAPTNVYGVPEMSDLVTATASNDVEGITSVIATGIGYDFRTWDGFCRGRIEFGSIPLDAIRDEADIYVTASLDASNLVSDSDNPASPIKAWPQVVVRRFVGTDYYPQVVAGDTPGATSVQFDSFNAFSPAMAPDGTAGQFQSYAWKIPALPFPLSAIASIEWAIIMSARPNGSAQLAAGYVHVQRGTGNNMVRPSGYTTPLPSVGQYIRPINGGDGEIYDGIVGNSGATVYQSGQWREVTGIIDADTFTVSDSSAWPPDDLDYMIVDAAQLATVNERETGLAFVYGAITRDSQFEVSTSAGRTYSGSPVTLARDVARDIFRRDLAVPLSDTTSYAALPDDACTMALVQAEDSAAVLARMCREFNWVAGHNQAGQEVATAWLSRLFSATSDYSVTSSDMVAGSITGLDTTALEDLVTLPSLRWDWTQADGYRQQGAVTEVSTDPASLTADNYLQTISGFGDFSTSLDAYQILHGAWQASGLRRADDIEYRYGGDPLSLYIPARMEWAALRKDLATFRINDTHAAAYAYVGQRIAVSHKRYTAGGTGYGTLVATYWCPAEGQVQLTVMFDPAQVVIADGQLYVDTIDSTEATPLYIDQLDGVSTQYIDTLGV